MDSKFLIQLTLDYVRPCFQRNIEIVYGQEVLSQPRKSPWGNTQRDQKEALEFS